MLTARTQTYTAFCLVRIIAALSLKLIEHPADISTMEGSNITLKCIVNNPSVNVIWCQNKFCTLGATRDLKGYPRYSINGNPKKGEHNLVITNVHDSDSGIYQCQVLKSLSMNGLKSREAYLNVYRSAEVISLQKPLRIRENQQTALECIADYSYPSSKIRWHPEEFIKENSISVNSSERIVYMNQRELWAATSVLTFNATYNWYNAKIDCIVDHPAQIESKIIHTIINFKCLPSVKIQCDKTFPIMEGDNLTCQCNSWTKCNSEPISWRSNVFKLEHINKTKKSAVYSFTVTRDWHNRDLTCLARNTHGVRHATVRLNVTYEPRFFYSKSMDKSSNWSKKIVYVVDYNERPFLECYVDCNMGPTNLKWVRNGTIISNENRFQLERPIYNRIEDYRCIAQCPNYKNIERTVRLIRDGLPIAYIDYPIISVELGSNVKIICKVNMMPRFKELTWKNDLGTIVPNSKYRISENKTDTIMYSTLTVHSVQLIDATTYNCCVTNSHGTTVIQSIIRLKSYRIEYLWFIVGLLAIALTIIMILIVSMLFQKLSLPCSKDIQVRFSSSSLSDKSVPDWFKQQQNLFDLNNDRKHNMTTRALNKDEITGFHAFEEDSFTDSLTRLPDFNRLDMVSCPQFQNSYFNQDREFNNHSRDLKIHAIENNIYTPNKDCIDALIGFRHSTKQQSTV
ncbi:hypothetical protein GJ496_007533 [Pomphorhynchus laevis]|nr:hypothetical protein GJ496_007533 [Pomphorhynchus laevis]